MGAASWKTFSIVGASTVFRGFFVKVESVCLPMRVRFAQKGQISRMEWKSRPVEIPGRGARSVTVMVRFRQE
jgi:hypothetical protein